MKPENRIVLFDGVCNFCNSSIQFIIRHDPKGIFKYAALQSDYAKKLVGDRISPEPESVILYEDGKVYDRTTAALKIARHLNGLWPLLYIFIVIPAFLRDPIYKLIAKNRYKWFGKQEACMVPSKEIRDRFLDQN
jgi:predicted DCC family thiol-disulfide oxidoreductase YuxK